MLQSRWAMLTISFLTLNLLAMVLSSAVFAAGGGNEHIPRAVRNAIAAVVRIHVVETEDTDGREVKQEVYGSGAIIGADGYVITNHHVAGKGKYFTCTMDDKSEVLADLVASDVLTDIAVLKLHPRTLGYPCIRFGDSRRMQVGQRVFAIGSPLTLDQSVTSGMVSNTALSVPEEFPEEWFVMDGENLGTVIQWIAHDAAIFPGNSGGPLVNSRGEIIGINEVDLGLSGAIPGNLAQDVATQLIAHGMVKRGWLGFSVQPLLKSSTAKHGVLVNSALDGSPAQLAGFQPGDVLIHLDGKSIDVHTREELPPFNLVVMALGVGKSVKAVVLRNGREVTLTVTPAQRPPAQYRPQEFTTWGMCASDIGLLKTSELHRKSFAGVLVTSVRPGGPVDNAKPQLKRSDVIVEIAGKPVADIQDLRRLTREALTGAGKPVPLLLSFERDDERFRTVVTLAEEEVDDPGREARKAWLPAATQVLTEELAKALGHEGMTGVCVTQVYPGTDGGTAGLHVGDIITGLDDKSIVASQLEDIEVLPTMVREYKIGDTVELTVLRDNRELKVPVTLAATPALEREMKKYRNARYEFTARDIAFADRSKYGLSESHHGVVVDSVTEGGWAKLGHLQADDLLLQIDGKPVENVDNLAALMQQIAKTKPECIVVEVRHGASNLFLEWRAIWVGANEE